MTEILSMLTMFVPLFLVVWIANIAEARRRQEQPHEGLALVVYILLGVLYGIGVLAGALLQVGATVAEMDPSVLAAMGSDLPFESLRLLALGLWLPSLLGILLLLPA